MKNLFFIILLSLLTLTTLNSSASCLKVVYAKYRTGNNWSQKMEVEMNFLTGYELNEATATNSYEATAVYAVVLKGRKVLRLIKITTTTGCDMKTDCGCIENFSDGLEGVDQSGLQWILQFS